MFCVENGTSFNTMFFFSTFQGTWINGMPCACLCFEDVIIKCWIPFNKWYLDNSNNYSNEFIKRHLPRQPIPKRVTWIKNKTAMKNIPRVRWAFSFTKITRTSQQHLPAGLGEVNQAQCRMNKPFRIEKWCCQGDVAPITLVHDVLVWCTTCLKYVLFLFEKEVFIGFLFCL